MTMRNLKTCAHVCFGRIALAHSVVGTCTVAMRPKGGILMTLSNQKTAATAAMDRINTFDHSLETETCFK